MTRSIVLAGDFTATEFRRIVALIRDMDTVPGRLLKVTVIDDAGMRMPPEEAHQWIAEALPPRSDRDTSKIVKMSLNEAMDDRQMQMLQHLACPDCDKQPLTPGPQGGMNQNWACSHCGAEFNLARHGDVLVWAHRVSPFGQPNARRLLQIYGIRI